ncbi:MAG: hypothetical protein ACYTAO_22375 [Planctomycetota bacterium]
MDLLHDSESKAWICHYPTFSGGYLFDSMRGVAEGKGKLQGNKEIVEWQWFAQGQGASSIRIMEKVSDDRFIAPEKYILPDGSTMEGKGEMTRKKTMTEK